MKFGLDRLSSGVLAEELRTRRVGLLAHPASVDRELRHISEVLSALGIRPRIVFGPEHGYGGEAQDMIGVADAKNADGTPIVSLYGDRFEALSPTAEQLSGIDVLLIDLADVGSRYYTFVWTALLCLRAAAKAGVEVVVLDRPNPLGGEAAQTEGALQEARCLSFVGLEPVPVRHGLTVGEVLSYFARKEGLTLGEGGQLRVVSTYACPRGGLASGWDRPFVITSPNMPTFETALVYPGGCLLEGTNLSEGRGLTRPFEIVGAPFVDGARLARELAATGLAGFVARPLTFQPTFHKHAKQICGGVQIHPTDPAAFRPYATYLALVALCAWQAPDAFRWRTERYEFVDDIPAFDLLTGSARAREAIDARVPLAEWLDEVGRAPAGWGEQMAAAREAAATAAV